MRFFLTGMQEAYWRIPAAMTPDQLNAAATALTPPSGGVASDMDDSSEEERPDHMTDGQGHVTESSSDEGDGVELTRAEALAALRRSKGKSDHVQERDKSANSASDREKGVCVCVRANERADILVSSIYRIAGKFGRELNLVV